MLRRQSSFCFFNFNLEFLDGSLILGNIDAVLLLNKFHEMIQNSLIEILTSQMSIPVGSNKFEDTVIDSQNGDIECSSS
jgi:hypothetical protein